MRRLLAGIVLLSLPMIAAAQPTGRGAAKPAPKADVVVNLPPKCLAMHKPPERDIPAPRVVSTFPAQGAIVRPGKLILRITFDLPMACTGAFIDDPPLKMPLADGDRRVVLTYDRRTFRTEGHVDKDGRYGLWMNKGRLHDFESLAGLPIAPFELTFSTSSEPPVTTVEEALAQDTETLRDAANAGGH